MVFKRKAVRVKPSRPGFGGLVLATLAPAGRPILVWVLPVVALVAFSVLGLRWCRARVAASPIYQVRETRLTWQDQGTAWWEKESEKEINRCLAAANGMDMLDPLLLPKIAATLRACPWVQDVTSVSKQFPSRIEVKIVPRLPGAAVACATPHGTEYLLAGEDGVRLPKSYPAWPAQGLSVPFITGVASAPPAPGGVWAERSVSDAIQIIRLLRTSAVIRAGVNVTAIDVSNYGGRRSRSQSEFLVLAENNCIIEWGRAPDTDKPGELPVQEKIAKFERFLAERNPTSNRTLDLRFAGRVVVNRRNGTDGDNS